MISVQTGEYARRADFYDYFFLLDKPANALAMPNHDRSPAKGRNTIIEHSIKQGCTHILFIDDDMTYEPDALDKLVQHDKDIVSGLYLSRAYPHQPLVFDLADEDGSACPMYLLDKPSLVPIVAAGFGFLLVKTSIFDKLEKPYIRLGELNPEEWCDDIGFFKRVREAGIQSYCDMSVCLGHIGTMIIKPKYEKGQWYTVYDTNGTGAIMSPQITPAVAYEFRKDK